MTEAQILWLYICISGKEQEEHLLEMRVDKMVSVDKNSLLQATEKNSALENQGKAVNLAKVGETWISSSGTISLHDSCSKQPVHNYFPVKRKHESELNESIFETKNALSRKRIAKSKYQNHYGPSVPMTKQEEAKWRLEARKKRNRDSAATSRKKVQSRIIELEYEVKDWKSKYDLLYQKMNDMEKIMRSSTHFMQPKASGHENNTNQFLPISYDKVKKSTILISPTDSPNFHPNQDVHIIPETFSLGLISARSSFTSPHGSDVVNDQHINEFVSRQA